MSTTTPQAPAVIRGGHYYLAGPMRGYPKFNFPAFARAAEFLRFLGATITSPAEMDEDLGFDPEGGLEEQAFDLGAAMVRDFRVIIDADGIILMEGWENSTGARAERFVAEQCGKDVFYLKPVGHSYSVVAAPEWNGDPRKPVGAVLGLKEEPRLDCLQDFIDIVEAEGYAVRKVEPLPAALRVTPDASVPEDMGLVSFDLAHQQALTEAQREADARMRVTGNGSGAPESAPDTTNPKDMLGVKKPQLHLVPRSLIIRVAQAMKDGAAKYGPFNWRTKGVRASVYVDAADRHLGAWFDGEEVAADSGVPHLAHAAACIGILIDAEATGNLVDDRPTPGPAARLIKELTEQ